jgi:hypothetical protein
VVNDWLLAVWMILSAGVHCHNSFVLLTKQIAFMRYIYFLEGVIFVILSFLVLRWSGLAVVILCSILCTSVFSYAYGIFRVSRFFELTTREVALAWLQPMGKILLYYLPVAGLLSWAWASASGLTQLVIHVLFAISVGGFIFLRFGLPPSFQNELLKRIPNKFTPFFKRVFLKTVN